MNDIANTTQAGSIALLDGLAKEAQYYSMSAANSMYQLGRVLTEAKALLHHGEWTKWIRDNAGCSDRTAQSFMAAYRRFGESEIAMKISDRSKIFKMLALPEGTEEAFMEENDVAAMTSREVEAAVRKVRAEMQAKFDAERAAEQRETEIPQEIYDTINNQKAEIIAKDNEIRRIAGISQEKVDEALALRRENQQLINERDELDGMLNEAQQEFDRMQKELLDFKSSAAKGDAERAPTDELTYDIFSAAVSAFVGTCARLPEMRRTFTAMDDKELRRYEELLQVIERWAKGARDAMSVLPGYFAEEV